MDTQLFIILLFVVIIVLAIVTRKLSHTALIVALAANFMVICINYHKIKKQQRRETRRDLTRVDAEETFEEAPDSGGPTAASTAASTATETPDGEPPETIYGQDYVDWKRYDDTPIDVLPRSSSINDNVAARGLVDRTKRAITSNLLKDVDYYRYHFGKELDIEERKPWWGRYDR